MNKNNNLTSRGSRKLLIVLLISFIAFFILLALFIGHRAIAEIAARGLKTEIMDVYVFSLVYLLFSSVLITLPLLLLIGYHGIHSEIIIEKVHQSLLLCGLKEDQLQAKKKEFEVRNNWKAFVLPMLVNLVFMFLLWGATLFPDGISGMLDDLQAHSEVKFGLSLMFPIIAKKASLVTWVFLGGYFYVITVMIRRWMRSDLTTNVLWKLDVRLAIIVILGLCLIKFSAVATQFSKDYLPAATIAGFGFLVGIVPDFFLRWLVQLVKRVVSLDGETMGQLFGPSDLQKKIDGLSFWQADRLAEEGIESIQDLAMKEIPDLLISTRFDTPLLLTWVDQALLCNQVGDSIDWFKCAYISKASDLIYLVKQENGLKGVLHSLDAGQQMNSEKDKSNPTHTLTLPLLENVIAGLENAPNLVQLCHYWDLVNYRNNGCSNTSLSAFDKQKHAVDDLLR